MYSKEAFKYYVIILGEGRGYLHDEAGGGVTMLTSLFFSQKATHTHNKMFCSFDDEEEGEGYFFHVCLVLSWNWLVCLVPPTK